MKRQDPLQAIRGGYGIEVLVFGGGAAGMVLELAGSRLLAPYFGNSIFVWTSLIGVMLAFMSLGYFLGGRLADKHLDAGNLYWIIIGAAISVALVGFSESWLLPALSRGTAVRLFAVISAGLLFAVPSTLLGMVSPYCIRLRMHAVEDSGATVGSLYALSTIGSIVGTFGAGFWLIAAMGTHDLILFIAVALGLLALIVLRTKPDVRKTAALAVLAVLLVLGFAGVAEGTESIDTQYDRYFIREIADPVTGETLVGLSRDEYSAESAAFKASGKPYRFEYYDYYDLAGRLIGGVDKALVIGGGTFSYPRLFVEANPQATVDAVEIDPALYDIAKDRFGYVDDQRIGIYLEDGRTFLNRANGPYDAIYVDAFKSEATVPYQLTTRETWKRCFELLEDDGVLVMNVVASPNDERAPFFNALYATIDDVFPQVAVFAVQPDASQGLQNTMIMAMKSPDADIESLVAGSAPEFVPHLMPGYRPPAGTKVLTDDFAPVDQYLLGF